MQWLQRMNFMLLYLPSQKLSLLLSLYPAASVQCYLVSEQSILLRPQLSGATRTHTHTHTQADTHTPVLGATDGVQSAPLSGVLGYRAAGQLLDLSLLL